MKELIMNFVEKNTLLLPSIITVALMIFSTALFSADTYYFAEGLYTQSEIKSEAQKDNGFDDELFRRGMSTSEDLFEDQTTSRWGANVGRGYRDGRFLYEASIYIDPAAEVKFKNNNFGVSHLRTDTFGGILVGGVSLGIFDVKGGLHITFQEADYHNWVTNERGVVTIEEHGTLKDWSSGLAFGVTANIHKNFRGGCILLKDIGDVDKTGTDNMISCGAGVVFR